MASLSWCGPKHRTMVAQSDSAIKTRDQLENPGWNPIYKRNQKPGRRNQKPDYRNPKPYYRNLKTGYNVNHVFICETSWFKVASIKTQPIINNRTSIYHQLLYKRPRFWRWRQWRQFTQWESTGICCFSLQKQPTIVCHVYITARLRLRAT